MTDSNNTLDRLSQRERSVAQHYANGLNHKAIAERLHIAPVTVRNHIAAIYRKLAISNKAELAMLIAGTATPASAPEAVPAKINTHPAVDARLQTWLESLALAQYIPLFAANAIDWTTLTTLDEQDLHALGITALGHRKRLLKALAELAPDHLNTGADLESECRRLTVLLCRLNTVSTEAKTSDLETVLEQFGIYKDICQQIVSRYDAYIAHILDTTLHVYFGYPRAHEDDAERAVRASLELLAAITETDTLQDAKLALRIAITTGPVIIGETTGKSGTNATEVIGETPSLAEALLHHAAPDSVLIDAETRHLLGTFFECRALAPLSEHGANKQSVWQVLGELPTESRFAAQHGVTHTPLVSRNDELALLQRLWNRAKTGAGQVLFLMGEPGIGKSRLSLAFLEQIAQEPHRLFIGQCSPLHVNSAFHPFIQMLESSYGIEQSDTTESNRDKLKRLLAKAGILTDERAARFAELITEQDPITTALSARQHRVETLDVFVGWFKTLAATQNTVLILEDLQWLAPSSEELLDRLIEATKTLAAMLIITCRAEYKPSRLGESHMNLLALKRLSLQDSHTMITGLSGSRILAPNTIAALVDKTDGVPLFIEELTKTVLHAEADREPLQPGETLPALPIPNTLEASLMARLDQMAAAKKIAQVGAVIGREFSYQLIAAVTDLTDNELQAALTRLIDAELIFSCGPPPQASYTFKHALVQDVAYQSLLSPRRQQLHERIARVLENADHARTKPELLAHHYSAADLHAKAVDYWLKAGQQAHKRSAYLEALAFFDKGLTLLGQSSASSERNAQMLQLEIARARVLVAVRGYTAAETGDAFLHARRLCRELRDPPEIFAVLRGQFDFFLIGAQYTAARAVAEECLHLAQVRKDNAALADAHRYLGTILWMLGELPAAQRQLERAAALYDPRQHSASTSVIRLDPRIGALIFLGPTLCLLGYPEQALVAAKDAVHHLQQEPGYAHTQAMALSNLTLMRRLRREYRLCGELAKHHLMLAHGHGLKDFVAVATANHHWVRVALGETGASTETLKESIDTLRVIGFKYHLSFRLGGLAEALAARGRRRAALGTISEALSFAEQTDERWSEAELWRLKGESLLRHSSSTIAAEGYFQQALAIASQQEAKWWELRSATSLARLWRDQGKRQEAYDLLAPVYNWFTEGFDTADLKDAKALLTELMC